MWFLASALAAGPSYTLSFPERRQNRVHVHAEIPASPGTTTLFMPVWTPGSYLIREYARHVESVQATDPEGEPLPLRRVSKNRWEVDTTGPFQLDYDLYAHERTVRTNWVDTEVAVLNGAATFIVPLAHDGGYRIEVDLPDGWKRAVSALSGEGPFRAPDLRTLIDSPLVVGNPEVERFEVDGVEHLLVDFPTDPAWSSLRPRAGARKVVETSRRFWGSLPYDRYLILNWLAEGGGGLEHARSTLLMVPPTQQADPGGMDRWLTLLAHEHFHAWNGKRLHPRGLGPFDYEREVYTPDLWVVEGFTSYYDDLLLVRAGILGEEAFLSRLSDTLRALDRTPGRHLQSASAASTEAWIKHYRPEEDTPNSAVSYYTKGAVIAWLLDAHIRARTDDARSLDDGMRHAYATLVGDPGYTPEAFRDALSEGVGLPLQPLISQLADSTEELDLSEALRHFGLQREIRYDEPDAWLGVELEKGRVARVRRDGPAATAGVNVGDELIGLDGTRIVDLKDLLSRQEPGKRSTLLVARDGDLISLPVLLGAEPAPVGLQVDPGADRNQNRARQHWLSGR